MKVALRQRKKGNKISLYLDYYHKGKREYEYLGIYLTPEPEKGSLTKAQKDENKKMLELAETIRSKRFMEIQNETYDFRDKEKMKASFQVYYDTLAEKRKNSTGNYGNWLAAGNYLKEYTKGKATFSTINKQWVQGFKDYLDTEAKQNNNTKAPLSQNSKYSYFNKIRAALRQAHKDGLLKANPADQISPFKQGEPQREFLTLEELQTLAKTECESPILKKAFLFSCLTGLRWSDIHKLTWSEVQHSKELGNYIRFRQKKTKGAETLPISAQAREMLGEPTAQEELVFIGLTYNIWYNAKLTNWIAKAGITKKVTFHCARHTYATLQLTLGTDIYTVSKLLGHKELKTTQIYAKIIDEKKVDAANRIKLE